MKQIIDIELFKENPQLFFSQLPEKAEVEFQNLLEFILFKYNVIIENKEENVIHKELKNKKDFLLFLKKGFFVSETEIQAIEQTQKEINKWEIQEF